MHGALDSSIPCTQGLLDLEGTALTPILVSLVKKDAGLLDAFGKGASEDIQVWATCSNLQEMRRSCPAA